MEMSKALIVAIATMTTAVAVGLAVYVVAKVPAATASVPVDAAPVKKGVTVGLLDPITQDERTAAASHVAKISEGKASVADVFRGPNGYLGVVVGVGDGKKFIGWMTPQLDAFFVGAMFDKTGKNVTQAEMVTRGFAKAETPQSGVLPPEAAIRKAVDETSAFVEGTSGPIVTAFVDFNCSYCRAFYQRSRPFVNAGAMRIKWVPVAILADDSLGKAAAVMSSPDPNAAVALSEENRLAAMTSVPQVLQQKIGGNTAVLNLLSGGKSGTPTILVQKRDGSFAISPGLPQDLGAFLANANS